MRDKRNIFITGPEGIGKTTLLGELVKMLRANQVSRWGFLSEAIRESGRAGFEAHTLSGTRVPFAHVALTRGRQVGPYRVDVGAFEAAVMPELGRAEAMSHGRGKAVGIIDEVGRLQCSSSAFIDRLDHLLNSDVQMIVVLNEDGGPYVRHLRNQAGRDVLMVTERNRGQVAGQLLAMVLDELDLPQVSAL